MELSDSLWFTCSLPGIFSKSFAKCLSLYYYISCVNQITETMKKFFPFLTLTIMFLLIGCAGSGSSTSDNNNRNSGTEVTVDNPNLGLDVYMRRLSGVRVRGSGSSASVNIRGSSSSTLQSDPRPLFIIDGIRAGRNFSRVYSMIDMQNVNAVRVITLSRATILYGHEGSNGVIEIVMKEG